MLTVLPTSEASEKEAGADGFAAAAFSENGERVLDGPPLVPGSEVRTDGASVLDLAIGRSSDLDGAAAVLRLFPGTSLSIRSLGGGSETEGPGTVEFDLEGGSIAAKVGSSFGPDSFFLSLPEAIVSVRGGTALVAASSEEQSLVAVLSGAAAVLPQGPLLAGLTDGRFANPVAGAVVRTAFAFAPVVRAGEELSVGTRNEDCEAAYSALLPAAERAFANGIVLEEVPDPSAFIAARGTAAEAALRRALSARRPRPVSTGLARYSAQLESLRALGALSP